MLNGDNNEDIKIVENSINSNKGIMGNTHKGITSSFDHRDYREYIKETGKANGNNKGNYSSSGNLASSFEVNKHKSIEKRESKDNNLFKDIMKEKGYNNVKANNTNATTNKLFKDFLPPKQQRSSFHRYIILYLTLLVMTVRTLQTLAAVPT